MGIPSNKKHAMIKMKINYDFQHCFFIILQDIREHSEGPSSISPAVQAIALQNGAANNPNPWRKVVVQMRDRG